MNERDIFIAALDKATAEERSDYLSVACAGDSLLRERVEGLLQTHERTGEFLQTPLLERLAEGVAALEDAAETARDPTISRKSGGALGFLSPSNQPGSLGRLGHYEVQEVIGSGGMGIVLRAFDEKLHRVVAIKVMTAPLATSTTARKRFLREARAAAAVCHDHIVTIHAVEEAGELPYLVMQCVSGMSLQQRLDRDGPLALHEILRIGMQTAAGLAAAHAQGLIHRDIKPANILLENGVERVKITDFGLALAAADASVSQTGIVAGTPQYMAPEQARGEALDCRTDLFSLGSVLYAICTGRAPFRASNSMAVLKRVCDDAPNRIREANADVPEWLVELIDKLQAKNPSDRYQSAAEVAALLGQRLAQLQHSTALPPMVTPKSAPARPAARRWRTWSVAAVVLLGLTATLGIAEGTGATKITATVVRLLTSEGTLVVEMTDPGVKLTIEGDGGLVITGAGLHEVHLKPGSYKLQADKNGQPVQLERELVSIVKSGREVVRVKLENPLAQPGAKGEKEAFVLLGGKGDAERKFDTLAEAVQRASVGDVIEIRGNGPFVSEPINCARTPLTIRSGAGFRPVIQLSPVAIEQDVPLLTTSAALVLEGLELQRANAGDSRKIAVHCTDTPLHAANCRFLAPVWSWNSPACVFRNCEFLTTSYGFGGRIQSGSTLVFENCLHRATIFQIGFGFEGDALQGVSLQIKRNTFVTGVMCIGWMRRATMSGFANPQNDSRAVAIDASQSIIDVGSALGIEESKEFREKAGVVEPGEDELALQRLIQWRGERNVFPAGSTSVVWRLDWQPQSPHGPISLQEWKQFWKTTESQSQEGRVRYQGANLLARTDLGQLTPDDFRLLPDSAGYRAGSDSKDLGADVDLVGPGPAYERWKGTSEYKEWLKETGQLKDLAAAKPETGAFVLLGGQDVADRKFDSLAEAVQAASDGDTIEVRGNGPFLTNSISIKRALVIRAGVGFRPVVKAYPNESANYLIRSNAPLVVEGLDLQWLEASKYEQILSPVGPLAVANCRFFMPIRGVCIGGRCSDRTVRNCDLSSPGGAAMAIECRAGKGTVVSNCLIVGHNNLADRDVTFGATVRFTANTFLTGAPSTTALIHIMNMPRAQATQMPAERLSVFTSDNVFDSERSAFNLFQPEEFQPHLTVDEAEKWLPQRVEWREERNLYTVGSLLLQFSRRVSGDIYEILNTSRGRDLTDWNGFWGLQDTGSSQRIIRFHGGDLRAKVLADAATLTPDDFRLRADSAGYRAGPGGKDLGADVDLVGPGPAYERWKQTPEYREWLKETGQMK